MVNIFSAICVNPVSLPLLAPEPNQKVHDDRICTAADSAGYTSRHNGKAMVSFASGNAGFLEMEESTRDKRMPKANVGRFAPAGSTLSLK